MRAGANGGGYGLCARCVVYVWRGGKETRKRRKKKNAATKHAVHQLHTYTHMQAYIYVRYRETNGDREAI